VTFEGKNVFRKEVRDVNQSSPPCGNKFFRDTAGAEGFVHVHSGIHGIGDLDPETLDWHNPVAEVTIRRVDD